jgi:hypothetical protein
MITAEELRKSWNFVKLYDEQCENDAVGMFPYSPTVLLAEELPTELQQYL